MGLFVGVYSFVEVCKKSNLIENIRFQTLVCRARAFSVSGGRSELLTG